MNLYETIKSNANSRLIIKPVPSNDVWLKFKLGDVTGSAKVFIEGSDYGISGFDKISKLSYSSSSDECNYDRGWDIEPKDKELFNKICKGLEDYRAKHPYSLDESEDNSTKIIQDVIKSKNLPNGTKVSSITDDTFNSIVKDVQAKIPGSKENDVRNKVAGTLYSMFEESDDIEIRDSSKKAYKTMYNNYSEPIRFQIRNSNGGLLGGSPTLDGAKKIASEKIAEYKDDPWNKDMKVFIERLKESDGFNVDGKAVFARKVSSVDEIGTWGSDKDYYVVVATKELSNEDFEYFADHLLEDFDWIKTLGKKCYCVDGCFYCIEVINKDAPSTTSILVEPEGYSYARYVGLKLEDLEESAIEDDEYIDCEWCGDRVPLDECKKELNLGWICRGCQNALYSRGEHPVYDEQADYHSLDDFDEAEGTGAKILDFEETGGGCLNYVGEVGDYNFVGELNGDLLFFPKSCGINSWNAYDELWEQHDHDWERHNELIPDVATALEKYASTIKNPRYRVAVYDDVSRLRYPDESLDEAEGSEDSTEKYWDATTLKQDVFLRLMKFNFDEPHGCQYIITNDANEVERFRADSDEEAIGCYDSFKEGLDSGLIELMPADLNVEPIVPRDDFNETELSDRYFHDLPDDFQKKVIKFLQKSKRGSMKDILDFLMNAKVSDFTDKSLLTQDEFVDLYDV